MAHDVGAIVLICFILYTACFLVVELYAENIETRQAVQWCQAQGYDTYRYYSLYRDACTRQTSGDIEVMQINIDHGDETARFLTGLSILFNRPDALVIRKVKVDGNA